LGIINRCLDVAISGTDDLGDALLQILDTRKMVNINSIEQLMQFLSAIVNLPVVLASF
jgi:hypothetical protein